MAILVNLVKNDFNPRQFDKLLFCCKLYIEKRIGNRTDNVHSYQLNNMMRLEIKVYLDVELSLQICLVVF